MHIDERERASSIHWSVMQIAHLSKREMARKIEEKRNASARSPIARLMAKCAICKHIPDSFQCRLSNLEETRPFALSIDRYITNIAQSRKKKKKNGGNVASKESGKITERLAPAACSE